jgi:hypothetical protein
MLWRSSLPRRLSPQRVATLRGSSVHEQTGEKVDRLGLLCDR